MSGTTDNELVNCPLAEAMRPRSLSCYNVLSDCSDILQNVSGTFNYPTAEECDNDIMLRVIPMKEGESAYLQF